MGFFVLLIVLGEDKGMVMENVNRDDSEVRIDGFLREPNVRKILDMKRSTFWHLIRTGIIPRPCKLSTRTSAWRRSTIQELCDKLAKGTESGDVAEK